MESAFNSCWKIHELLVLFIYFKRLPKWWFWYTCSKTVTYVIISEVKTLSLCVKCLCILAQFSALATVWKKGVFHSNSKRRSKISNSTFWRILYLMVSSIGFMKWWWRTWSYWFHEGAGAQDRLFILWIQHGFKHWLFNHKTLILIPMFWKFKWWANLKITDQLCWSIWNNILSNGSMVPLADVSISWSSLTGIFEMIVK